MNLSWCFLLLHIILHPQATQNTVYIFNFSCQEVPFKKSKWINTIYLIEADINKRRGSAINYTLQTGRGSMKGAGTLSIAVCCIFILLLETPQAEANRQNKTRTPAIIVFGDSVVDPGNNNAMVTMTKCNFAPYGKDLAGGQASGRFSNGKIPSDLMGMQNLAFMFFFFCPFFLQW